MNPTDLLPLISVMTVGTTAGIVAKYSIGLEASMAVPGLVTGFMCIGYAVGLSLLYYVAILHNLLTWGLPAASQKPALVILVGPVGQFATALCGSSAAAEGAYSRAERLRRCWRWGLGC
jgi:tellurite resistance protein TehA-like permease